jgi:hypothetical protein
VFGLICSRILPNAVNEHYAFAYTDLVLSNHGLENDAQEEAMNFIKGLMGSVVDVTFIAAGSAAEGTGVYCVDNPSMDFDFMVVPNKFSIREHEQRDVIIMVPDAPGQVWVKILDPDGLRSLLSEDIEENDQLFQVHQSSSGKGNSYNKYIANYGTETFRNAVKY